MTILHIIRCSFVYICYMKNYAITLQEEDKNGKEGILTKVYRLTANAAVQRGDALRVATEDNKDMLTQFINEGKRLLNDALGRYSTGDLDYSMPENWPDRSSDIDDLSESFLVNYSIAKWYELNGTGERFISSANEALEEIVDILGKRTKPGRL